MSKFYIVATPIGNMGDITFRAIETLKNVDLILCEDTRVTKNLLNKYDIKKPTMSYHAHSKLAKVDKIIELFGDIPRIELFARQKTEGWDAWGNEIESDITL